MYSHFRSGAGSSYFFSLQFPNCFSPRQSASVFANCLRSYFSVSQPKALRSRAGGHLSQLHRAMCPERYHSSFCSPFSPAEYLAAATNLSSFTATGPGKVAYPMLKHLPHSGMDFLSHIFFTHNLCSHLENILYSHLQDGKASRLSCMLPAYLSLASQSFLNASFYRMYFSFMSLIPFSLPAWPVPPWTFYSESNSVPFSVYFGWV